MQKNVALFYNPVAGGGTFKNNLDLIIKLFQKRGLQVVPWRIENNAGIKNQLAKLDPDQYHSIIACGGDGTVHGVVNALMQCESMIPLGIFPEGTANDVANYLKIPQKAKDYCQVISDGQLAEIDLGMVNGAYFVNVASSGFLTDIAHEVDYTRKNALGKMAYYLKTIEKIPKIKPLHLRLTADGQEYDEEIFMFLILNGGTVGGFSNILPPGKMSDGQLDFIGIKSVSAQKLAQLLRNFNSRQFLQNDSILYITGQEFSLNIDSKVATDLDGEKGPRFPWKVSVCSHALQVRVPVI